jgi:hypothetical protein
MSQCHIPSPHVIREPAATRERLKLALNEAEEKAHKNLVRYKFMNFGYWAAIWQHLNRVGNFRRPNPFADYVKLARAKGGEIDAKRKSNY